MPLEGPAHPGKEDGADSDAGTISSGFIGLFFGVNESEVRCPLLNN